MIDLLYNHSSNVYSANGEDGINEYILKHLGLDSGVVLEIGAWDGFFDSNCANLWSDGSYNGILIEATSKLNISDLESRYDNINCYRELISSTNTLEDVIDKCKFDVDENNFVLASIDVDGDDLNVAKSLGKYKNWEAYTFNDGKGRVCFAQTKPTERSPKKLEINSFFDINFF